MSEAGGGLKPHLMSVRGTPKKRKYFVNGDEAVLGRDDGLPVSLRLEGVSRKHARVVRDARGWWLEDLQSTNGTFLNGQRTKRSRLRHLDVITLGRAVDLLFLLRDPAAGSGVRHGIVRAGLVAETGLRYEVALGEATLGRSTTCNLVVDNEAVSKRHATLERGVDQIVLRDLDSANGTLVNGARVQVAVLKDGDTVALAGVEPMKVNIEMGDVLAASGSRPSLGTLANQAVPQPSRDWKTRYEWDSAEMAAIEAVRRGEAPPAKPKAPALPTPPPVPPKPAAATPPRRPVAAPPAPPKPAAAPKPAPPEPPAPPKPPAPTVVAPPPPPAPGATVIAPPPVPPPPPAAAAPPAPPPPPPSPAPAPPPAGDALVSTLAMEAPLPPPIRSIHLRTKTKERVVIEPGSYLIGRAADVPLRFEDNTVSRRHATLVFGADRRTVEVRDEGGANGTFVNGQQLGREAHRLANDDELRLGHFVLRVRIK